MLTNALAKIPDIRRHLSVAPFSTQDGFNPEFLRVPLVAHNTSSLPYILSRGRLYKTRGDSEPCFKLKYGLS
jgi:hypothetical protein